MYEWKNAHILPKPRDLEELRLNHEYNYDFEEDNQHCSAGPKSTNNTPGISTNVFKAVYNSSIFFFEAAFESNLNKTRW